MPAREMVKSENNQCVEVLGLEANVFKIFVFIVIKKRKRMSYCKRSRNLMANS